MQAGRKKYLLGTTSNDERESWIKEYLFGIIFFVRIYFLIYCFFF